MSQQHPGNPSTKLGDAVAAIVVLGIAGLVFSGLFFRETNLSYSIGYNLYGAERTLLGEVPYRDFHTLYPPAIIYVNAALFDLFGVSLYTALLGVLVFKALTTLAIYLAAREVMPRAWAMIPALSSLIWLRPNGPFKAVPMHYGALFLALALWLLLKYLKSGSAWRLVAAGISIGVLALFKHNIGAYALIGLLLVVTVEGGPIRWEAGYWWKNYKRGLVMLGAFFLPIVPVLIYFRFQGALGAMTRTLLFGPGEFLLGRLASTPSPLIALAYAVTLTGSVVAARRFRQRPVLAAALGLLLVIPLLAFCMLGDQSRVDQLLFYLPVLLIAAAALVYWFGARFEGGHSVTLAAVIVVAAAASLESFPRLAREQVVAAMPFVTLLLIHVIHVVRPRAREIAGRMIGFALMAVPLSCFLIGSRLFVGTFFERGLRLRSNSELTIDRGRGVRFPKSEADEIDSVVRYIQERVPAGGYLFAQSYAGSSYLFLADRRNPSGAQFWGGVGVNDQERGDTLRAIEETQVNLIVTSYRDLAAEKYGPMRDYIAANFALSREFNDVIIYERRAAKVDVSKLKAPR
ncbi:MAG TPA: glycosyltransferase family 39 protein [Blastocatellia bacterium]|nr:glycosyltransferase family 39 protein [Blastocatellia bacterium]